MQAIKLILQLGQIEGNSMQHKMASIIFAKQTSASFILHNPLDGAIKHRRSCIYMLLIFIETFAKLMSMMRAGNSQQLDLSNDERH